MSAGKDLTQHVATMVAAAWVLSTGGAPAAVGLVASFAALSGLGHDRRVGSLKAVSATAADRAMSDLTASRDFTEAHLARARTLLDLSRRPVQFDARLFADAALKGDPDGALAAAFLAAVDFADDDDAPRRVLDLTLRAVIRACRTHEALAVPVTQELLVAIARSNGIEVDLLTGVKADTTEILALLRKYHEVKETTVPEATLFAMARKIIPHVADLDEALKALDAAADLAAEALARGETGSNIDAFVDETLRRLAALTGGGKLDEAAAVADLAADAAEAGLAQLLDAAIRQHLLAFDAGGAARQLARRLALDAVATGRRPFDLLLDEQVVWYQRGRDTGQRLHLEMAIALSRHAERLAAGDEERGEALNTLGVGLRVLGEREDSTEVLAESVEALRTALRHRPRARNAADWSMTQLNLGNALISLGERLRSPDRLREAVAALRQSLEERPRDRNHPGRARCLGSLGGALSRLGELEGSDAPLVEAVDVLREALGGLGDTNSAERAGCLHNLAAALTLLDERSGSTERQQEALQAYLAAAADLHRAKLPLQWAESVRGLGDTLRALGRFDEAVAAYRSALEVFTPERAPRLWASAKCNLGDTLRILGERDGAEETLREAIECCAEALSALDAERMPAEWAIATGNQGVALRVLAQRRADVAMAQEARDQIAQAEATLQPGNRAHMVGFYAGQLPLAEALVAELRAGGETG